MSLISLLGKHQEVLSKTAPKILGEMNEKMKNFAETKVQKLLNRYIDSAVFPFKKNYWTFCEIEDCD